MQSVVLNGQSWDEAVVRMPGDEVSLWQEQSFTPGLGVAWIGRLPRENLGTLLPLAGLRLKSAFGVTGLAYALR